MKFSEMNFKRKFSLNFRKDLRLPMAKMTFTSRFLETDRGDLYPVISRTEGAEEYASLHGYSVVAEGGHVERLMCEFFPFATYSMTVKELSGTAGFVFAGPDALCEIFVSHEDWETFIVVRHENGEERVRFYHEIDGEFSLVVSARQGNFDIYVGEDEKLHFIRTARVPSFDGSCRCAFYQNAKAHVKLGGRACIGAAESWIDCGIGQADIRPFKYENGEPIVENGRVFLAISARMEAGGYQAVLSWLPGTADFKMEGAIFYCPTTRERGVYSDVASCYIFDRRDKKWRLWQRSGASGHILAYAEFDYDVRFGVNVVDVNPLPMMDLNNIDDTKLLGKKGDEDPDFMYDEIRGKWLLANCRLDEGTKKYQYYFFESDYPDRDYKFIGKGPAGEETGGSIVRLDGKLYFVCGNSFSEHSSYRVYEWGKFDEFEKLSTDYPDGGFRGWGTVIPVCYGTRRRFFWLTFDRMLMNKGFNWSYGNLYCFEAETNDSSFLK